MHFRIGQGYDVHRLVPDQKLILGGIAIPHDLGLKGHSDADVLTHAICDALLGAAALGDIGYHFPPTDEAYRNINSLELLAKVHGLLMEYGYGIGNIDTTLCLEKPKLASYIPVIRETLANTLDVNTDQISVKATTSESLGFEGRQEGISAIAIALIQSQ